MSCMQVRVCSLANNQLSGTVRYMPNLLVLNMSSNELTEPGFDAVPAALQLLYLANNSLTGNMLQLGRSTSGYMDLKLLDLSDNNVSGSLPQYMPHKIERTQNLQQCCCWYFTKQLEPVAKYG